MVEPAWSRAPDEMVLDVRMCNLGLKIAGTPLADDVRRLYREMERRRIRLRPHVWLSSEWFSPDGIPGIAVPFYLAHPRLLRLEKKMMLEVEGARRFERMKILRHEAGHAVSTAYRLHRRKSWREVFGPVSQPYPDSYRPRPFSRNYVLHLDFWYAQAHPAEDFAETFAVWLNPRSRWRHTYRGWPALEKLRYVEDLMREIRDVRPPVRNREQVEPLRHLRRTLRAHYRKKQELYEGGIPDVYDRDLHRLFPKDEEVKGSSASSFLRRVRPEVREVVSRWTGEYQYTIDRVLRDMIERSRDLRLRLTRPENEAVHDLMLMVAVQTMNALYRGGHRIAL